MSAVNGAEDRGIYGGESKVTSAFLQKEKGNIVYITL